MHINSSKVLVLLHNIIWMILCKSKMQAVGAEQMPKLVFTIWLVRLSLFALRSALCVAFYLFALHATTRSRESAIVVAVVISSQGGFPLPSSRFLLSSVLVMDSWIVLSEVTQCQAAKPARKQILVRNSLSREGHSRHQSKGCMRLPISG